MRDSGMVYSLLVDVRPIVYQGDKLDGGRDGRGKRHGTCGDGENIDHRAVESNVSQSDRPVLLILNIITETSLLALG